jgi:tetratricopeptide (TPR) repeat protein
MKYPASVAVAWETTFAQLTERERRLLEVLAWLAPEAIPLLLFDAAPLVEAIPDPLDALAGLAGYSLARFDGAGDAVLVHRLVQEITRRRGGETARAAGLQTALVVVATVAPDDADDVRTWPIWTTLAPHAAAVARHADAVGVSVRTSFLMHSLAVYLQARCQFAEAEPLYRRAMAIDEASYGPDHPAVARDLNNLAMLLQATNRLAEAERLSRRNLETLLQFTRATGHEHPNFYAAVANYRALLEDMDETRSRSSTNWMRSAHGSTFRFPRGEYS